LPSHKPRCHRLSRNTIGSPCQVDADLECDFLIASGPARVAEEDATFHL